MSERHLARSRRPLRASTPPVNILLPVVSGVVEDGQTLEASSGT